MIEFFNLGLPTHYYIYFNFLIRKSFSALLKEDQPALTLSMISGDFNAIMPAIESESILGIPFKSRGLYLFLLSLYPFPFFLNRRFFIIPPGFQLFKKTFFTQLVL